MSTTTSENTRLDWPAIGQVLVEEAAAFGYELMPSPMITDGTLATAFGAHNVSFRVRRLFEKDGQEWAQFAVLNLPPELVRLRATNVRAFIGMLLLRYRKTQP